MKLKRFSISSMGLGGSLGSDSFQDKKKALWGMFKQDIKNGNYGQALKHSFGARQKTIDSYKAGTYGINNN